jgi:hypothetical protein
MDEPGQTDDPRQVIDLVATAEGGKLRSALA